MWKDNTTLEAELQETFPTVRISTKNDLSEHKDVPENEFISSLNLGSDYGFSEVDVSIYKEAFSDMLYLVEKAYLYGDEAHNLIHIKNVLVKSLKMVVWARYNIRNFNSDMETKYVFKLALASFTHDMFTNSNRKEHEQLAAEFILLLRDLKSLEVTLDTTEIYINLIPVVEKINNLQIELLSKIPNGNLYIGSKFNWLKYFTKYDLEEVIFMVKEHRASRVGNFTSVLCDVFATADKDNLDVNNVIHRSFKSNIVRDEKYEDLKLVVADNKKISFFKQHKETIVGTWDKRYVDTYYHMWEKFSSIGYMFKRLPEDSIYFQYHKDDIKVFCETMDKLLAEPEMFIKFLDKKENK